MSNELLSMRVLSLVSELAATEMNGAVPTSEVLFDALCRLRQALATLATLASDFEAFSYSHHTRLFFKTQAETAENN